MSTLPLFPNSTAIIKIPSITRMPLAHILLLIITDMWSKSHYIIYPKIGGGSGSFRCHCLSNDIWNLFQMQKRLTNNEREYNSAYFFWLLQLLFYSTVIHPSISRLRQYVTFCVCFSLQTGLLTAGYNITVYEVSKKKTDIYHFFWCSGRVFVCCCI